MDNDEWLRLNNEMLAHSGIRMSGTTPNPSFDPDEPWSELPTLKKISPAAGFDLIEALRQADIPVHGSTRSAGIFSGGKVHLTISVPTRLRDEAVKIVSNHFSSN